MSKMLCCGRPASSSTVHDYGPGASHSQCTNSSRGIRCQNCRCESTCPARRESINFLRNCEHDILVELDEKIKALEQQESDSSDSSSWSSSDSDESDDDDDREPIARLPMNSLPEGHGYKGSTQTKRPRREKVGASLASCRV